MKTKTFKLFIFIFIILTGLIYNYKYLNSFPSSIHAWAQADRYAIALGFIDNNFDFFKPQTYIYNHQFPNTWEIATKHTITAVDFPAHDFIPALLMKLTGNTSPFLFRIYILLYSFIGLFFLFKLSYSITKNQIKSAFILLFASTSPVFVYYQGGFLPSIPSLANAIIGIYFYQKHLQNDKRKNFTFAILFLTIAALARTTFTIPLIAVFCLEFIRLVKKTTSFFPKIIPVLISILLIIAYKIYNGYLSNKYGSNFLSYLLPAESFTEAIQILKHVVKNWLLQYFSLLHYLVLLMVVLSLFIRKRVGEALKSAKYLKLFIGTYFFGCFLFAFAMLKQFHDHDYYFIDTFYLPLVLLFAVLLSSLKLPTTRKHQKLLVITLGLIGVVLLIQPVYSQQKRRSTNSWDRTKNTISNFNDSSRLLDSLDITKSSKVLVIDAVTPNIPFILLQRKGYAVMNCNAKNIKNSLTWDFDCIVFQKEYFIPNVYNHYPDILKKVQKIAENRKIIVAKLSADIKNQSLYDFLGLKEENIVHRNYLHSDDNEQSSLWKNLQKTENKYDSISYYLSPSNEFGVTFKTSNLDELKSKSRTLIFSSEMYKDSTANCELVISINEDGQRSYYQSFNINNLIKKTNKWEDVSLLFQLPKVLANNYEFAIYIWNPNRAELRFKNFGFKLY